MLQLIKGPLPANRFNIKVCTVSGIGSCTCSNFYCIIIADSDQDPAMLKLLESISEKLIPKQIDIAFLKFLNFQN